MGLCLLWFHRDGGFGSNLCVDRYTLDTRVMKIALLEDQKLFPLRILSKSDPAVPATQRALRNVIHKEGMQVF